MNICLVCLRTDRRMKPNNGLAQFHDELCGFTLFFDNISYCGECEYLLTKFYKLKQKCRKASEIYRDWASGEIKDPIHALHNLLRPSSLGVWEPNPKTNLEINISEPDFEEVSVYSTLQDLIKNSYIHEIKLEYDPTNSIESIGDDLQNETVMENVPDDNIDDEKDSELGTDKYLTEKFYVIQNDFESEELLDIDIIGRTDTKNEEEQKVSKKRKVTCNKKQKVSKKRKVTCNKKQKVSKKRKLICNTEESKSKVTNIKNRCSKWEVIERLGEELVLKLSSFGKIETDEGTTVDRDLITKFLQHDAGAPVVRRLREATCREDVLDLSSDIEAALTTINNDWTNDDKPDYKSMYDIEYLSTLEKKLEEFQKRKTYEHYVKAKHKCEVCYQPFRGPIALDSHKQIYHDESAGGQFCAICKMRVTMKCRNRNRHAETHSAVYRCKLCPLVTYYRNTMKEHAEKHRGKTYPCESCNVTYKCMSAYYSHMATYHRRRRIVCTTCGRGFLSEKGLLVHTSITHRDAPPTAVGTGVRCEECDVTLPSQSVYEAHIRDVHEPPPDVETKTLPQRDGYSLPGYKTGARRKPRKEREVTTRSLRKQTCRVCKESRAGAGWLKTHFRWAHADLNMDVLYADTKLHLCDVCGRGHSGHVGDRKYKCHMCGKGFLHSAALNEHLRGVHYNIRRVKRGGMGGKRVTDKTKRVSEMEAKSNRIVSDGDDNVSSIDSSE